MFVNKNGLDFCIEQEDKTLYLTLGGIGNAANI